MKDCYGCDLDEAEELEMAKQSWCYCDDSKHKHCPDCDGQREHDRSYEP